MATKPANTARWAQTAGGTLSSEIVEPSSGEKDSGWADAQLPPHDYFNWWQNLVHQWVLYLNDGAFTGTHSFAGSTSFAGGLTGDTNSTGDFQADDFYHTDTLELVIPPSAFQFDGTDWIFHAATASGTPSPSDIEAGGTDPANAPVHLPTDAVITEITVAFNKQGNTVAFALVETVLSTGAATAVVSDTNMPGAATGLVTHTFGPLSYRVGAGLGDRSYECAVSADVTTQFYGARIKYTRPRP